MAARLTDEQVRAIRERAARGERLVDLARVFNRTPSAVSCIVFGKRYPDAGGPLRVTRPPAPDGLHWCNRCRKHRPVEWFSFVSEVKDGKRRRGGYCRACRKNLNARAADKRRGNAPRKMPKKNARGDVWCGNCGKYLLPDRFTYPPSLKGKPSHYCRVCVRALGKIAYRKQARDPQRSAAMKHAASARQRRDRRRKAEERVDFILRGIETLRQRGFTATDIADVLDISPSRRRLWERGTLPSPNAAERMRVVLLATADWPDAPTRTPRRNRPPQMVQLIAETRDDILAFPLRSRWKEDAMLAAD